MPKNSSSFLAKLRGLTGRISLRHIDYVLSVVITVVALIVWVDVSNPETSHYSFIEDAELSSLDTRFKIRGLRPHDENIVIVGMDEKTLQRLKAFPIPRRAYAQLLDQLTKGGAKIVAFDVNFPTPALNTAEEVLKKLLHELGGGAPDSLVEKVHDLEASSDDDKIFAEAIRRNGNVLLGHTFLTTSENALTVSPEVAADYYSILSNHPFPQVLKDNNKSGKDFELDAGWLHGSPILTTEVFGNIRLLADHARSYGFINASADEDGVYRRALLLLRYRNEDFYPSLDVEAARQYSDIKDANAIARIGREGMEDVELGPHRIKTEPDGSVLINYAGPFLSYQHYSMIDVMEGTVAPETFRGKLVLIGPTALAFGDQRDIPFSGSNSKYMGVEIHANVIDNILHNEERGRGFLSHGNREFTIDLVFILVFGLGLSPWFSRTRPLVVTATMVVVALFFLGFNYFAFKYWGMWLSLVVPMGTLVGNYAAIISSRVFFEEREKQKVRKTFERYVSPGVIKLIEDDPKKYFKTGGESKELTMMFSDIRGFTGISEGLTPDQLVQLLNEYLSEMTDILFDSRGTLDKYIGDAIMAFWGSPYPYPNHAELACNCALKMSARLDEMNMKWELEGKKPLNIGIGLNTGEVNVGNMGSIRRFAWTVMGDSVNLASRLEGTTKAYHVRILVSEFLYEHKFRPNGTEPSKRIKECFVFREVDRIRVVGKARPVKIYELLATARESARYGDLLTLWNEAYAAYTSGNWMVAAGKFEELLKKIPEDGPAQIYLARVRGFLKNPPPPDWDGVYVLKEK